MVLSREDIAEEIRKCSEDPKHFINNYVNVIHPIRGVVPFKLFKFQQRIVDEVIDTRFNLVRKFRQAGITTLCAAYSLWSIIFKEHHNVMVVSIGDRESTAFLARVMDMYEDLPTWLKPVIKEKNKHTLHLSTGSKVKSQPAGAGRGESVSHLIVDEAAFIERMREFWAAVYPTVSTGGKVTMLSTVNGMSNLFYELWRDANKGENRFNVVEINWREHPDYTEKWAEETRANMPPRLWLQEYECEFLGTGDTFIDFDTLQRLTDTVVASFRPEYQNRLRVFKDPDPYHQYMITVDASYGREHDYSAFHVINLYNGEQVAEFYSNVTSLRDLAQIISDVGIRYNLAYVVIERNGLGMALIERLFEDIEYENMWMDEKGEFGIQLTTKTREVVLSYLEDYVRSSKIKVNSQRTLDELVTFIINEDTGKVAADDGYHDDLVMSLANGAYAMDGIRNSSPVPVESSEEREVKDPYTIPIRSSKYNEPSNEDIRWVIDN
jgi:hypothetical protein